MPLAGSSVACRGAATEACRRRLGKKGADADQRKPDEHRRQYRQKDEWKTHCGGCQRCPEPSVSCRKRAAARPAKGVATLALAAIGEHLQTRTAARLRRRISSVFIGFLCEFRAGAEAPSRSGPCSSASSIRLCRPTPPFAGRAARTFRHETDVLGSVGNRRSGSSTRPFADTCRPVLIGLALIGVAPFLPKRRRQGFVSRAATGDRAAASGIFSPAIS